MLAGLDPRAWHVTRDVAWPGRPGVRLGHLVVGPPGVLVVRTAAWAGVTGSRGGSLRGDGTRRQRDLQDAAEAAGLVATVLGPDAGPRPAPGGVAVLGVLSVAGTSTVTGWIGEVLCCGRGDLLTVVGSLATRLDAEQVAELGGDLTARLRAPGAQAGA
ncbi:hypothetical protein GCM10009737_22720 [Nocardioides lentus]|uniref:NERD domain-containing protein n=1 Tax=Nocardioides lentus TaxID=338077 RepID=A0ABP5ARD7_9ACTN